MKFERSEKNNSNLAVNTNFADSDVWKQGSQLQKIYGGRLNAFGDANEGCGEQTSSASSMIHQNERHQRTMFPKSSWIIK